MKSADRRGRVARERRRRARGELGRGEGKRSGPRLRKLGCGGKGSAGPSGQNEGGERFCCFFLFSFLLFQSHFKSLLKTVLKYF